MPTNHDDIAIIGGGIAGMALAISLATHGIRAAIYESRDETPLPHHAGGGMMLCPNALRILDSWGLYRPLLDKAYSFDYVYYKNREEVTVDRYPLGGAAAFGYDAVRIFRQELVEMLATACRERGVVIEYGKRFVRVVEENGEINDNKNDNDDNDRDGPGGVEFEFRDGSRRRAGLLVGADGIHSHVRSSYVAPDAAPKFVGLAALTYAVPTAQLRIPADKDYRFPVSVASGNGVFVLAPQGADGGEMLAGTQVPFDAGQAALGREALLADTEALKARLRRDEGEWPDVVRSALEAIRDETMNVWPFFMLPALGRWASEKGRVLVLGDAAHAIPPTTGQGASMALEDAATLALVVKRTRESRGRIGWREAVGFWQGIRRERLAELVVLTQMLNNKRLPSDKMAALPREEVWFEESEDQMKWLYVSEIEDRIEAWVKEKTQ
ncbi:Putative FAD-binding domain, FAD/NAD(P)-binding domain superfamily [Colletotrichum destructivum]|uniref:FAD-binding domain, FAD/NAD(P)-binding domain superfamily n=1 Tax=Colletotrichum destructivum TaxID=34406 RepID=A0AAX4IFY1_9PEZI|nr:Putative FAD-binding domain, FAD/NAD(P)-binding domain superfamily [Colletotrichum destructivum]